MKHRAAGLAVTIMLVAAACSTSTQVGTFTASAPAEATSVVTQGGGDDTTSDVDASTSDDTPLDQGTDGSAAEADADEQPEPLPTEESVDEVEMVDLLGSDGLGGNLNAEELQCVAEELLSDDELAARLAAADGYDELSQEDQTTISILTFDCAPESIAAAFSASIGDDAVFGPEVGTCLVAAMGPESADRESVIRGFAALGDDQPVPAEAETPLVDTMVDCFPGDLFSDAVEAEVLSNPALANAVDFDCIDTQFSGEAGRPLWETVVRNPGVGFDQLDPSATEPLFTAIFGCLSFGKVVAAQAEASGVALSEESISCIDAEMADVDVAGLVASGQDSDEIGVAMAGCLTPEELSGLGG